MIVRIWREIFFFDHEIEADGVISAYSVYSIEFFSTIHVLRFWNFWWSYMKIVRPILHYGYQFILVLLNHLRVWDKSALKNWQLSKDAMLFHIDKTYFKNTYKTVKTILVYWYTCCLCLFDWIASKQSFNAFCNRLLYEDKIFIIEKVRGQQFRNSEDLGTN